MDDEYEEGMGEQRALVRDTGPAPYGMSGGGGFDSRGGTPARPRNVRHSSGGSSGAYGHSNGALESDTGDELDFRHDLDDAEPAAANLTEAQIQALIQQQVRRDTLAAGSMHSAICPTLTLMPLPSLTDAASSHLLFSAVCQVARLSARLNELDDELAEAEEDCEIEAEQQEQQRTTRTNR